MLKPLLLKLDLQLFADGEFGGYDPSTAYEGIQAAEPVVQPQGQGEGVPEMQGEPQGEPQLLDFGGRKVPAINEDLMGLHKDYTEQQRYITALQDQVNAYKQLAQQPQAQPEPQAPPEISANTAEWTEETWQQFYDNPNAVMGPIIQQAIQSFAAEKLDPILQERQWNGEIQRMYDTFSDFGDYVNDIQGLVDQFPDRYADNPVGLELAYYHAKATQANVNPAQLAQDPQFLNQYVVNNPQVQGQVLNQYLSNKQQVNQQIPTTMGRGAGGFTPQTPESSPTTLKEASRQFLKNLGVR
jgi:hypothetical protein